MYDIIIVGSGGAALSAAITLKQKNYKVCVISKTSNTASQTVQAQGGINAVIHNPKDSIDFHIKDTLKSAHDVGKKKSIEYMCSKWKKYNSMAK